MRPGLVVAVCAVVLTLSVAAWPAAAHTQLAHLSVPHTVHGGHAALSAAAMRVGRSVGSPTTGHLIGGMQVEETSYLRIVPSCANSDVRWGLAPLVTMIDRAARQVRRKYSDAVLTVGHLSRPGGGEVDRHASHESGRDADILFYVKNHLGKPVVASSFVPFRADGTAPTWPGATFDDARNWLLVTALVTDKEARVSHIFVAAPLRARLLAYAARIGAPPAVRHRAAELLMQPRGSLPHDDHFHVRIGCPSGMHECIEFPQGRWAKKGPAAHERNRGGKANPPPSPKKPYEPPAAVLAVPSQESTDSSDAIDDADGDL
ncbi:penicillin-insensitive murein endopeptidase [Pendulispora rubella]|uniref:Penicillin-insensitive murein endopeptidase n=1 Tax=Pendulispora rubella TaxID=2741070 RepID=A0ABZ2LDG8_9BACT